MKKPRLEESLGPRLGPAEGSLTEELLAVGLLAVGRPVEEQQVVDSLAFGLRTTLDRTAS